MNKVTLKQWGNSAGVRIPAALIESAHAYIGEEFSVKVNRQGGFTLVPISDPQAGWTEAFNALADANADTLIMDNIENEFDQDEWTW